MHIIRLGGPWQLFSAVADSEAIETTVPGDWSVLGADFPGPARFVRKFGLPTNLTQERVSLVIERVHAWASIALNGNFLGNQTDEEAARKYDITSLLQPRNEISIVLELNGKAGPGSLGEVRLEIEDP
jgi:hypothetical protein